MSYAFIFVHRQSSSTAFQFVKITCIKNFSVEFWSSSTTNKRSEKVYVLQRDKSVRETCQVLAIADSRDKIEEISRSKRWSVPKLSTSVIDNESDDLSPRNSSDSEEEKTSRKRLKSSKAVGLKQAQQEICEKYRKINKLDEYTDCDKSQSPINKEKTSDNFYFSTPFDYTKDPLSNSILSDIENINQNHKTCKKQLQFGSKNQTEFDAWATREVSSPSATETKLELAAALSQVKFWKNKYDNLLESKAFPLSEETGQIIIKLIKKSSIPETNNSTDVSLNEETIKKQCSEVLVSENHIARTRQDKPLIEEDEAAVLTSLLKNQFKDAGECVKTIIKSLWTDDELAERVVRKNAKINKKALTPSKVNKVRTIFGSWLGRKGFLKEAKGMELGRVNEYLGRTIDNAIRKKKRNKVTTESKKTKKDDSDEIQSGDENEKNDE